METRVVDKRKTRMKTHGFLSSGLRLSLQPRTLFASGFTTRWLPWQTDDKPVVYEQFGMEETLLPPVQLQFGL